MITKILVVDDHELVRKGFIALLQTLENTRVCGEASNGKKALDILEEEIPDILLLDVEMPVMNGLETLLKIREHHPSVKVIMLTMTEKADLIRTCIANGAAGFLFKNASPNELQNAINTVMKGDRYLSKSVTDKLLTIPDQGIQPETLSPLSNRETEIAKLIAQGYSATVIAEKLFISPQTVDTHRKNILRKLGLSNVNALTRYALKAGLIE